MEKLELLSRYQILLGTPPSPTPTVLGSEGPLLPPVPTLRRPGEVYLKVTRDLEEKSVRYGRRSSATMLFRSAALKVHVWR